MESLLTLSIGDYRAVELMLRLVVALVAMTALLLGLSTACVSSRFRFPLILSSVALFGAAWFESGVWIAWKEGFELAGSSYCVTGQLLAGEDRIIAWAIAVPALLGSLALLGKPREGGGFALFRRPLGFPTALIILAFLAPSSSVMTILILALLGWMIWQPCPGNPCVGLLRAAHGCVVATFFITLLGGWHLLPLGKSAEEILVRGEIIRSLCDLLEFVLPALLLLAGILGMSSREASPNS